MSVIDGGITAYRAAFWDTPWWVNPNRTAGRYNRAMSGPVQYWSTHPLTTIAERLRWLGHDVIYDLETLRHRLWAATVPMDGLVRVTFDNARTHGLKPEHLVGDDYAPTQDLADRLRADGAAGLIAPSAALPGTESIVLFGPRVLHPYLVDPIDPEQVSTAHAAEGGVATEVVPFVRWRGDAHVGLAHWQATGAELVFREPPLPPT